MQEELEKAVRAVTGERAGVRGAGRTDAGVHALAQAAHFDTRSRIPAERFAGALNAHLPADIAVLDAQEAKDGFHAQYGAKGKVYRYVILNRATRPALDRSRVHWMRLPLNVRAMRLASRPFVGRHDFREFAREPERRKTTVRTVKRLDVRRRGDRIAIEIEADGFLYNMARRIVGALIEAAGGPRGTAPPEGLTLVRVIY